MSKNTRKKGSTDFLRQELEARKLRNGSYSLRAFARDCGISPGYLSLILNGKRKLELAKAVQIAKRLGWAPATSRRFEQAVFDERAKNFSSSGQEHEVAEQTILSHIQVRSTNQKLAKFVENFEKRAKALTSDDPAAVEWSINLSCQPSAPA